jgi:predicted SAM-dependent methyltransferase
MNASLKRLIRTRFPFAVLVAKASVSAVKHQLSKQKIRRLLSERSDLCLELGAGNKAGVGNWITVDVNKKCDLFWDLRKGLPFPSQSISRIYSSHFFEHLSFTEMQEFLQECRRALIPGGHFSICVPNARIFLEAYFQGSEARRDLLEYQPACNHTTAMDYVNYIAYMAGEHKYLFDEENLLFILKAAHFRNVRSRQLDPALDLKQRDFVSIYAEANT